MENRLFCYTKDIEKPEKEGCFPYFRNMKRVVLIIVCCLFTQALLAQVIFRNDFIITNRKHKKLENKGLTLVSINLDSRPNWNQLINGRGGRTMVIDVQALRHPKKTYTYQELAERVYVPPTVTGPFISRVPAFLLVAPKPTKVRMPKPELRTRHSQRS